MIGWCAAPALPVVAVEATDPSIEFARDVRPILAENCFQCHGPDADARKAELRLDLREGVLGSHDSPGVVVPNRLAESELYVRITAENEEDRMPPVETHQRLAAAEVDRVRRWIEQGASWQPHWAFQTPRRPLPPVVRNQRWPRNAVDTFVLARLEQQALNPAAEADRQTLIRRVTLDLTGLPPTPAEVDAFLLDTEPNAYERLVDRLLASPRYGERMAVPWLNAARYADTYGYQDDGELSMWRWRDWVIEAFNSNLPFDRFTVEQLAGDLLPDATFEQRLATGFNRNHRANSEGGAIPAEFRTEYVVDRVDTTATVWLGLTLICARCHDHKYDPISQREFYQLFAFFNNVPEDGRARKKGNTPPLMPAPTREQQARQAELESELDAAQQAYAELQPEIQKLQREWERTATSQRLEDITVTRGLELHFAFDGTIDERQGKAKEVRVLDGETAYSTGRIGPCLVLNGAAHLNAGDVADYSDDDRFTLAAWVKPDVSCDGSIMSRTEDEPKPEGIDLLVREGRLRVHLNVQWIDDSIRLEAAKPLPTNDWTHVAVTVDGSMTARGVRVYFNGVLQPVEVEIDSLYQSFGNNGPFRIGASGDQKSRFRGSIDEVRVYQVELSPEEIEILAVPASVTEIVARPANERSAAEARKLSAYFEANHAPPSVVDAKERVDHARRALQELVESFPDVMVMEERVERRPTHLLHRGQYDQPREEVTPDVPSILGPLPTGAPRNRLGFARWLVDPGHPLTARVTINRLWQMSFGTGLVNTPEDFGSQGEPPSHPQLLDWLACELVEGGWDIKRMRRMIVTSATYRQSSGVTPAVRTADPGNRLLTRGPRFRLPAEVIRDQALYIAGLLVERQGGPSVRPYQPAGLWEELSNDKYKQDHGERLYRRSLYTFWKRTVPFPAMALLDAPNRETCHVRDDRTNTPLQALVLLNETTFVEAARAFAERAMKKTFATPHATLDWMFHASTSRVPRDSERQILVEAFQHHLAHYRQHPKQADQLLAVGEKSHDRSLDVAELAAYTAVANTLLSLDEAITQH